VRSRVVSFCRRRIYCGDGVVALGVLISDGLSAPIPVPPVSRKVD
jgi:hypothetical protein